MTADEELSEMVVELLGLLSKLTENEKFFEVFQIHKAPLIITGIFNLLKTQQQEFEMIDCDPQEFVNLGLDTCDK